MKHQYSLFNKYEIQHEVTLVLDEYIKEHMYISARTLTYLTGKKINYHKKQKDVEATVFYRKLIRNVRAVLLQFVSSEKIEKTDTKGLYKVSDRNIQ